MREIKGLRGSLFVEGAGAHWLVVFRDGGAAIFSYGRDAVFPTEAEAVKWAYWTLNEPERMAADELGEDD